MRTGADLHAARRLFREPEALTSARSTPPSEGAQGTRVPPTSRGFLITEHITYRTYWPPECPSKEKPVHEQRREASRIRSQAERSESFNPAEKKGTLPQPRAVEAIARVARGIPVSPRALHRSGHPEPLGGIRSLLQRLRQIPAEWLSSVARDPAGSYLQRDLSTFSGHSSSPQRTQNSPAPSPVCSDS